MIWVSRTTWVIGRLMEVRTVRLVRISNGPKIVQLISGVKQKFVLKGWMVTFNWHLGLFSLITVASITPRIVSSICLWVGPALVPKIFVFIDSAEITYKLAILSETIGPVDKALSSWFTEVHTGGRMKGNLTNHFDWILVFFFCFDWSNDSYTTWSQFAH